MGKKKYERPQVGACKVDCSPILAGSDTPAVASDGYKVKAYHISFDFEEDDASSAAAKGHGLWDEDD